MNVADFTAMSDLERRPKISRRWDEVAPPCAARPDLAERPAVGSHDAVAISEDVRSARVARQGIDCILDAGTDLTDGERVRLLVIRDRLYQQPHRWLTPDDERWLTTRWEWHATEYAA